MAKAIPKTSTFYAKDRKTWRKWLEKNHLTAPGVWLIYYKKDSGKTRVSYNDAVEEALCFGWIDTTLNPIDEKLYAQLFTPRKPKSTWAASNKTRVERLNADGLMTDAGLAAIEVAKTNGSWTSIDHVATITVPPELQTALDASKTATKNWPAYSPSCRKQFLFWLAGAKRAETRAARIKEIVACTK